MGWAFAISAVPARLFIGRRYLYRAGGGPTTSTCSGERGCAPARVPCYGRLAELHRRGVILLYLLWNATSPIRPLNAVTFVTLSLKLQQLDPTLSHGLLAVVLYCWRRVIVRGRQHWLLGGPTVLANMAVDSGTAPIPQPVRPAGDAKRHFPDGVGRHRHFDMDGAMYRCWWCCIASTYSSPSRYRCSDCAKHWWENRYDETHWKSRLLLALLGFMVVGGILVVTVVENSPRAAG